MQEDQHPHHLPLCLWARPSSPPCVYFLADHLDAVLAAGEDMRRVEITWISSAISSQEDTVRDLDSLRDSVEDLRSLELTVIARLLKSRERAEELARVDGRLKLMARLFLNGTGLVLDAVPELKDATAADFNTGDAILAYLRSRGLIAADAAAPEEAARLRITGKFPVGRRLPLGPLMDLVAQFLDTMELHHDIYTEHRSDLGPTLETTMAAPKEAPEKTETPPAADEAAKSDAARASTPPRRGYRSLTMALAELDEQERDKQTKTAS